ncbi:DUF3368 domain-containing protein [Natrinema caseinilyticum]|uniref:DUF3368 domain-containing protein n=1 Tax=Natrinema caseinilyticum TaxID=2961570 RepID=UPI0020C4F0BC|nr:DUF3368 domain-containing protein [Natrinema caseinilyticum]
MPTTVVAEVTSEPAASELENATGEWVTTATLVEDGTGIDERADHLETAAIHLDRSSNPEDWGGDVPLLAAALSHEELVIVTDDKPLRKTCKVLSIPVTGSLGILIRAVERGDLDPATAKGKLEAMDEVGARLSVRLLRRAERLIDDAA